MVLTFSVCSLPLVSQDLVSQQLVVTQGQPRMQASDGLLHLQAGVQAQILGECLRSMYGVFLHPSPSRCHEQAIPVYTWRTESRITYARRSQEREFGTHFWRYLSNLCRSTDSASPQPMVSCATYFGQIHLRSSVRKRPQSSLCIIMSADVLISFRIPPLVPSWRRTTYYL